MQLNWFNLFEIIYLVLTFVIIFYYIIISIEKPEELTSINKMGLKKKPFVSIIIPTYNEETNIGHCVKSLRKQDYKNYEMILSDGGSKDRTVEIARSFVDKVIIDDHVPEGWIGKNWGCHLGSTVAKGEILLFTDADTFHQKNSLSITVGMLIAKKAGMLTMLPYQNVEKWWECVVPIYFFFSHFASGGKKSVNNPKKRDSFVAVGQYLLFTRKAYDRIDGHKGIKGSIVEDYAFGRVIKTQLHALYLMNNHNLVSARMYPESFKQSWIGFKKCLYAGTKITPTRRIIITILLIISVIFSPVLIIIPIFYQEWISCGINVGVYFTNIFIFWSYWRGKGKHFWFTYVAFPLPFLLFILTILSSALELIIHKKTSWKGRVYTPDLSAGLVKKTSSSITMEIGQLETDIELELDIPKSDYTEKPLYFKPLISLNGIEQNKNLKSNENSDTLSIKNISFLNKK